MSTLGAWLTISTVVTGGLLVGVILGWIEPPKWATPRRVVAILLVVAAVDICMTYLQQSSPVTASPGDASTAASAVGLVPVRTIDGAQETRTFLSVTSETTGDAHLVESSLNGNGHKGLGLAPGNGQFALVGSSQLIVSAADGKQHADGLELQTLSGKALRFLTSPPANETDTDPVITSRGEVYFLRTTYIWSGPNGAATGTRLMKVQIATTSPPAQVRTVRQVTAGPLSVNTAGTLLAGQCSGEACVLDIPSGRTRYATTFGTSSPVGDDSISPDGQYLAYQDFSGNAYGTSQIYVRDLSTGKTVMVSSLPGNNREPSWVADSSAPCLLFTNSQTSGDQIYLSCLSPSTGTALIGPGDRPVWLGGTLAPGKPSPVSINWRSLWDTYRSAILLIGTFVLGLLIGLLGGWFARPTWATRVRIVGMIVVLGVAQLAAVLVVPRLTAQPLNGLTTLAQLDPAQQGDVLLFQNNSSGNGSVFAGRLNGTNIHPLDFAPYGSRFIPVGTDASSFIYNPSLNSLVSDIQLVGPTGNEIRALTDPPPGETDTLPTLASRAREVFYQRSRLVHESNGGWTTTSPVVMRVSLAGGPAHVVQLQQAVSIYSLSADAAGNQLAAVCAQPGSLQACVYNLPGGRVRFRTQATGNVYFVALSPDGHYLAYSTYSALYVYSFASEKTFTFSSLTGFSIQPDWITGAGKPCLLFDNQQTAADTIYLGCLTPQPAWAPITPGENPAWLGA
ncbi:MAG: hypothetical protein WA805_20870 [Trebonia sp.]|uniref:TolB family protein n=1 Tax=Trebonia sp. TaxID=2767075 RepID=UPI003C8D0566